MLEEYSNHDIAVYAGYIDDNVKLLQSASGGVATALSEFWIDNKGVVVGVAYSEDFHSAEYITVREKSDLSKLKGSKYIDCDKKNIYTDVKNMLENGEKVLFFGLPCIIAALYKFIGKRHENLMTCELVCHGPTHKRVHEEYVKRLEKKYRSKIVNFSVRYKKDAWHPPYLRAEFKNGKIFESPFYSTEYGFAFRTLAKESCYNCHFKGNNRQADIMIGDFWGANSSDEFWNKNGVSSIFAETEKGNNFIKEVPSLKLFDTTFERAVAENPMVVVSRKPNKNKDNFSEMLSNKGLFYAVSHSVSFKTKVKKMIKRLLNMA